MTLYYYNLLNDGCESKFTINSPGTEGSVGLFNIAVPSASCGAPVLLNEKNYLISNFSKIFPWRNYFVKFYLHCIHSLINYFNDHSILRGKNSIICTYTFPKKLKKCKIIGIFVPFSRILWEKISIKNKVFWKIS